MVEQPLLEVSRLRKHFPIKRGFLQRVSGYVKAVDDISFRIGEGETLGLVGESGCGKTTTGRAIVRALDVSGGEILYRRGDQLFDIAQLGPDKLKTLGIRREIQMVFQDPFSSLNPRMTVRDIVGEALLVNNIAKGRELEDAVAGLLRRVGLRPEYMGRYPHAFSGGQRQRIGIARTIASNPRFIVCDESVSALDVSVQAQILNLLKDLQEEFSLSYLFIAHDLGVVEYISHQVGVMYVGKLVELAETERLFANPRHPYTEALISAIPKPEPGAGSNRIVLRGEVADPSNPPSGCYFHPRCNYAKEICAEESPPFRNVSGDESSGHMVACHFAGSLDLRGRVVA